MKRFFSLLTTLVLCVGVFPVSALSANPLQISFSNPVTVGPNTTFEEILQQSDNFADGKLRIGDKTFVLSEHGYFELHQEAGFFCEWFGWWCPLGPVVDTEAIAVSRQRAKQIVIDQVIPSIEAEMTAEVGRVLPMLGFSWSQPLAAGTVIKRYFSNNRPLGLVRDSWFFFLDLEPYAYWGHRGEYVLVDTQTGEVRRKRVFSPPVINGNTEYLSVESRWHADVTSRFYPESLENMPSPAAWPFEYESDKVQVPDDAGEQERMKAVDGQAWMIDHDRSIAGKTWWRLVPEAHADGNDACEGKERKKIGFVIGGEGPSSQHDDGKVDGDAIATGMALTASMLRNLGVADSDIHRHHPDKTPKLDDVVKDLKDKAKNLGPCDKLFIYIFAHGGITDKDDDGKPDTPSSTIYYGHGEDAETMSKSQWGKHSLPKILSEIKAGDINIILESCYSGSIVDLIEDSGISPADGSDWHLFLASDNDKPSYARGTGLNTPYYTGALIDCVNNKAALKKRELGVASLTIEQIEELMKECQKQLADNPNDDLDPPPSTDINRITFTASVPVWNIQEGNGVTLYEVTITRSDTSRAQVLNYQVFGIGATDNVDFSPQKGGRLVFAEGQATATVTVGIYGDLIPEDPKVETVVLNFYGIDKLANADDNSVEFIITDDDAPAEEQSSSAPQTAPPESSSSSSSEAEEELVELELPSIYIDAEVDGLYLGHLEQYKEYVIEYDDEEVDTPPSEECLKCDPILQEIDAKKQEVDRLDTQRQSKELEILDIEQDINDANTELQKAQAKLDRFNNPRSWASSDGRTIDSSDLEAIRHHNRALWGEYRANNMNAQELSDAWGQQLTREQLDQIKNQIRQQLQNDVNNAGAKVNQLVQDLQNARQELQDIEQKMIDCMQKITELWAKYWECLKQCQEPEEEISLVELEIDLEEESNSDSKLSPGLTEYHEMHFDPPIYIPAGETVEIEVRVDIVEETQEETIQLTFACPECDALRAEIEKQAQKCVELAKQLADTTFEAEIAEEELHKAEDLVDAAEAELDAFNNPDSWIESEGRRVDSTDLRLKRLLNAGLWESYRNGDISAQELEDGWNKLPEDTAELREQLQKELEQKLKDAKQSVEDAKNTFERLKKERDDLQSQFDECTKKLDALYAKLQECEEEQCKEPKENDQVEWLEGYGDIIEEDEEKEPNECPEGTSRQKACLDSCDGECVYDSCTGSTEGLCGYAAQALACYRCEKKPVEEPRTDVGITGGVAGGASGGASGGETGGGGITTGSEPKPVVCPSGMYEDSNCGGSCRSHQSCNGSDYNGKTCYTCEDKQCAAGLYKSSNCDGRCSSSEECMVDVSRDGLTCYGCKAKPKPEPREPITTGGSGSPTIETTDPQPPKSCAEQCEEAGHSSNKPDFSGYIGAQIEGYSCVSGYTVAYNRVSVGSCACYSNANPTVNINTTVPTCPASPCPGTIQCGQSTSCPVDGGTATVSCNWQGWQKTGPNTFTPRVGG